MGICLIYQCCLLRHKHRALGQDEARESRAARILLDERDVEVAIQARQRRLQGPGPDIWNGNGDIALEHMDLQAAEIIAQRPRTSGPWAADVIVVMRNGIEVAQHLPEADQVSGVISGPGEVEDQVAALAADVGDERFVATPPPVYRA